MSTLEAILERLVPSNDRDGLSAHVLAPRIAAVVPGLDELLGRLDDFPVRTAMEQDVILHELEQRGDMTFARLVVAAQEAYWSDARSWPTLGYTTNLPGRP